jgi:hypothetical protein
MYQGKVNVASNTSFFASFLDVSSRNKTCKPFTLKFTNKNYSPYFRIVADLGGNIRLTLGSTPESSDLSPIAASCGDSLTCSEVTDGKKKKESSK